MTQQKIKSALFSWQLLLLLALMGLFVFFRVYRIEESLLFFNDIGRDYLVLWNWQQTGKPPLLGPQTSALPFNQSAFYFYWLFPFYLLSQGSAYATIVAAIVFYLLFALLGYFLLRKRKKWFWAFLLTFFLVSIQPQQILQGRFVWNPSFVTPCILFASFSFLELIQMQQKKKSWPWYLLWSMTLSLALATAFSYSALPSLLAFGLLAVFMFSWKSNLWRWILALGASLFFVNLPTVFFEFRHHFLLTQMMLERPVSEQPGNVLSAKLQQAAAYAFNLPLNWVIPLLIVASLLTYFFWRKKKMPLQLSESSLLALLAWLSLLITLASPIALQTHYIFGFLPLFLLWFAFLVGENAWTVLLLLPLLFSWLSGKQFDQYFQAAYRSVAQSQECAVRFCATQNQPLFVAVQSNLHPYHNGMEWQYLFASAGCQVKDLTTENQAADLLAVVVDHGAFDLQEDRFNELTQFGPAQEKTRFSCGENLQVELLERSSAATASPEVTENTKQ